MSNYESRAIKFARILVNLFCDCKAVDDYINTIHSYNCTHTRKLRYAHGVSRMVILRADYVIKFDMTPEEGFEDGRAGNCESELALYQRACAEGYEYLLAKPTVMTIDKKTFSIMPRINGVDNDNKYWMDYCTTDEMYWLSDNVCDLHEGNLGYRNGKVCVIDYAWDACREYSNDDSWEDSE